MNRIRELRKQRGWTQEQLAEAAGTSPQQIYKLEKSQRKLSVEWLTKLGKALKVNPAEIAGFNPVSDAEDIRIETDLGDSASISELDARMSNNLKKIRQSKGLTQEQLAELADTSAPQIVRLEGGERRLTAEWAVRLAKALKVNPADIFGFSEGSEAAANTERAHGTAIPELDARIGAGMAEGALAYDNNTDGNGYTHSQEAVRGLWDIPSDYVGEIQINPRATRIIEVIGDSMFPTLHHKDRIMVDTSDLLPSPAGIFALWDGMAVIVKRVEYVAYSSPPRVRVSSDNPHHETRELDLDEIRIIGRVKWFGRGI